ncbi:IclR family transcriptional regulator [Geodermatophilus sabuli]|uniref:Glycerol operon regulatory protein n=1 Tax=Geodermatophilus sabuli TaxID=1564158 RepID=A0A7K3W507_9ACTN|nr:IclR family transcriptional regulator [Geodermatophilus sabuli]NEK59453.1 IclR family transcriptional regulator [Geodermatophilus sabuli]
MAGNANEAGRATSSRLLAVLESFTPADPVLTLAEIAARTGLPKSTAHRLLGDLVEWGGIERRADARYQVGLRVWKLGLLAQSTKVLGDVAHPIMEDLHRASAENVQLAILDRGAALVVERIRGSDSVHTFTRVGARLPLHATAVGKVLAAYSPEAERELVSRPLPAFTPNTITDPKRLRSALARTRAQGIAYVFEEMSAGAVSVACPIVDGTGEVRAAVSIVFRSTVPNPYRFAAALRTAAFGIGRSLSASH